MHETSSPFGGSLFPDRQISVRTRDRIWQIALPGRYQAALAAAFVIAFCGSALAVSRAVLFQARLSASLDQTKDSFARARQEADAEREKLQSLAGDGEDTRDTDVLAQRVAGRIATLEQAVKDAEAKQQAAEAERDRLNAEAKSKPDKPEKPVARTETQHLKVVDVARQPGHTGRLIAVAPPAAAPAESSALPATETGRFDLEAFLARLGVKPSHASGGPYVALGPGSAEATAPDPQDAALLAALPLTAPLDEYQFESGFGVRVDPINGHRAMHTGIDLSGSYRAPVYSTSGGDVVFAGYAAAYGRMVEIDHGHGIHTRYAHLNRVLVNVGQHVGKHDEIGLLGSTGRSTGPHVHYEVLVNGVARNPVPFLEAGKAVRLMKAGD